MFPRQPLALLLVFLALFSAPLEAALRVGSLNCYLLMDPSRPPEGRLADKIAPPEVYAEKVKNLGGLARGLDVVGLQEVGGEHDAEMVAKVAGYGVRFVQGKDTYTGEDVATLVVQRPGLRVREATRIPDLEVLSKHLLVTVEEGGQRYAILNVHLIRPIGRNEEKHARQVAAMVKWAVDMRARSPETIIVVLGDFNNPTPRLLPLNDTVALTGGAPTHLDNKAFDHIFTSGSLRDVVIDRPPYPKRPNDLLKSLWTDHYLLKATVDRAEQG